MTDPRNYDDKPLAFLLLCLADEDEGRAFEALGRRYFIESDVPPELRAKVADFRRALIRETEAECNRLGFFRELVYDMSHVVAVLLHLQGHGNSPWEAYPTLLGIADKSTELRKYAYDIEADMYARNYDITND